MAFDSGGLLYAGINGNSGIKIINPSTYAIIGTIPGTRNTEALAFDNAGLLYAGSNGNGGILTIIPSTKTITGTEILNTGQNTSLVFEIKKMGNGATISISLTIRTKEKYGKNRLVNKKDYHSGNFIFSKNDQYQRDTFSTTVAVRNL